MEVFHAGCVRETPSGGNFGILAFADYLDIIIIIMKVLSVFLMYWNRGFIGGFLRN